MNKWNFVVKELKSLQQGFEDHQAIVELYVEQILLRGYNIGKKPAVVSIQQNGI